MVMVVACRDAACHGKDDENMEVTMMKMVMMTMPSNFDGQKVMKIQAIPIIITAKMILEVSMMR